MSAHQTSQAKSVYFNYVTVQWQHHHQIKLTSRKGNVTVPQSPEWSSCQWSGYVTLVKCHVQSAASLISVSHFHALLMEAGITRKSVSAACAYMFLWSHPLPLDKAKKKRQIVASIFGARAKRRNDKHTSRSSDCIHKIRATRKEKKKNGLKKFSKTFLLFQILRSLNELCSLITLLKSNDQLM